MPGFEVRAATIDHGVPALAFALEERARIDIWRNEVEDQGLAVGPWLRGFEDAVLRRIPDGTPISVVWRDPRPERPATLPMDLLRNETMRTATGRKIISVVDCSFARADIEKVARLAQRHHLTARQAGVLARLARAKRLVTLHYSPRYKGQCGRLLEEALEAFHGS